MSTKYTPIRFDTETKTTLIKLAAQQNTTVSSVVREMVKAQLEVENAKESIDFIREQINEEIKFLCNPQFDRLAKLIAKIGYQSVANFYLLDYIMSSILPTSKQQDFNDVKEKSRQMAIAYLRLNEKDFAEYMTSENKALEMLDLKNYNKKKEGD